MVEKPRRKKVEKVSDAVVCQKADNRWLYKKEDAVKSAYKHLWYMTAACAASFFMAFIAGLSIWIISILFVMTVISALVATVLEVTAPKPPAAAPPNDPMKGIIEDEKKKRQTTGGQSGGAS